MKAIKIDTLNKKVTEVNLEIGDSNEICRVLGCTELTTVLLPEYEILYLDNVGWVKYQGLGSFYFDQYPVALAGFGLIAGLYECGDHYHITDTKFDVPTVVDMVSFLPNRDSETIAKSFKK